jgi:large subunit ribosomal protein L2
MGKPLISQRRGKGSPSFKARSTRFKARVKYRADGEKIRHAEVVKFIDDPGRTGLLMTVKYEDGAEAVLPAYEGALIGRTIDDGIEAPARIGNILPLQKIPEGYPIYNLETKIGDGGSLVRSSGSCAYVVSKKGTSVLVKLPSKKMKHFDGRCRATIGCASGGGRLEKPLLKAGKGHYKNIARGHWYPRVRGVKMNAYDHPFGGKQHHGAKTKKGKGGAPGQHVGSFGAKRTGRKRKK